MNYFVRRPWDLPQKYHTPYEIFQNKGVHRREFLKSMGIAGIAASSSSLLIGCGSEATDEEIEQAGKYEQSPAMREAFGPASLEKTLDQITDPKPVSTPSAAPPEPKPTKPIVIKTDDPKPVVKPPVVAATDPKDPKPSENEPPKGKPSKPEEPVAAKTTPPTPPKPEPKPAPKPIEAPEKTEPENVNVGGIKRNPDFANYGPRRTETIKRAALEYTNFYEFSMAKSSWQLVGKFKPLPWQVEVTGECMKPQVFDIDDILRKFQLEERCYRHRCVETWAMNVPWIGFPLHKLLAKVEPKASAKFVRFESFYRPDEAPGFNTSPNNPWPYTEGLTIDEAMNELTLLTTGLYGEPLAKQNGAPIRIVTPWKYGFKCIKSIAKISLTSKKPRTFWNTLAPREYGFVANVDPGAPHPRWSQRNEKMLGTGEVHRTLKYNGYGKWVAGLYR